MPPFEKRLNSENQAVREVFDRYKILTAEAVDEEGKKYPRRITGYDLVPDFEHDTLTAVEICKLWQMTPDEVVASLSASEFLRRAALTKAAAWSQPTPEAIAKQREQSRMRRR